MKVVNEFHARLRRSIYSSVALRDTMATERENGNLEGQRLAVDQIHGF